MSFTTIVSSSSSLLSLLFLVSYVSLAAMQQVESYRPTVDDVKTFEEAFEALPTNGDLLLTLLSDDVVLCVGGLDTCINGKDTYTPMVEIQESLILADNGHLLSYDSDNIYYGNGYFLIENVSEYYQDYTGCSLNIKVTLTMFYNENGLIERWYEMPHDYDLFWAFVAHAFDSTGTVECPTTDNDSTDDDTSSSSSD